MHFPIEKQMNEEQPLSVDVKKNLIIFAHIDKSIQNKFPPSFQTLTLIKLLIPTAANLPWSSVTISGEPDSPDVGQKSSSTSEAQTVPGG